MDWIKGLCKGHNQGDIWSMDKSDCFFKALPVKGLAQIGKKAKGGKKSKQRMTVVFFVNAVEERDMRNKQIGIWWSKNPRCFGLASTLDKLADISYFDDSKSWMQVEIMEKVLDILTFQMERRNVILFLDNATVHPTSLIDMCAT